MPPSSTRLPWIDHVRTLAILFVVNMHACVTYSHVGDWYVMSNHEPTLAAKIPFILWQAHLQSFFMGLLFFIAGYFAHGSLTRRGPGAFVRERLIRLGLPALLYMLVIHPLIVRGINPWHADFPPVLTYYRRYLASGRFLGSSGPLWFAVALLIFCLGLVAWRKLRPLPSEPAVSSDAPRASAVWVFAVALGIGSFLVRLVQPLGTNVLNLQLGYFTQYVAAFATGVAAARHGWLLTLAGSAQARRAGWLTLFLSPVVLLTLLLRGMNVKAEDFFGGWHWQAFGLSVWEQLAGAGLSLGLLALFSAKLNRDSTALRWLSDRSFAVYVLHAPVLVALYLVLRPLPDQPMALALLLTLTGLIASYALADFARRVPGLRKIL